MSEPRYVIGIDLGTTNSVVSFTEAEVKKGESPQIRLLSIPQLVAPGSMDNQETLPSFVLLPGGHEVAEGALALPWNPDASFATGAFARERGAEIPQRLIASSKSWLCHTGVVRNKKILPWGGAREMEKMSPVESSSAILEHVKSAWNHVMAAEDESLRMENQEIYLTVPASFDPVARELTVKAAAMAGLTRVTLLEEPQAAFYAWLWSSGEDWRKKVNVGDLILVCDVGGGTTDFSLIQASEEGGDLVLERVAVGEHLLVGGDNMDLAMAHKVAGQMSEKGTKLDSWQMRGLWQSCRGAKEKLLADGGPDSVDVTIQGRGSGLIAGTIKAELDRDEMEEILMDGFFPFCDPDDEPEKQARSGMREMGLVYAADPSVTRHLAKFLAGSREGDEPMVSAVLFNGGVMKAQGLRERVLEVLEQWAEDEDHEVRELSGADYDLGVARGAAFYGLARRGAAVRIRGGLARSYYIGVEAALPAVPGMPAPMKALCVAPFGMEEGTESELKEEEFGLVVGEPVQFELLAASLRHEDSVGTVIEDWEGDLSQVTTLETELDGKAGEVLPITLQVKVTEVGTLELWCVSGADGRRWKLEFDVREKPDDNGTA